MSAESLYEALNATIADQLELDDPISVYELIGVIEMVKADVLASMMEGEDDPEPEAAGACSMPMAA